MSDDKQVPEGWPPQGGAKVLKTTGERLPSEADLGRRGSALSGDLSGQLLLLGGCGSKGVVLRFGKFVGETDPGLHYKWPWPIDEVISVPVESVQNEEFGFKAVSSGRRSQYAVSSLDLDAARMLTGDLNLAHVEWVIQYQISNPRDYLFNVGGESDSDSASIDLVRDVSEAVMRRLVGDRSVDEVISSGRAEINSLAKSGMQELLDSYFAGIRIISVRLQSPSPPEEVKDSFNAVNIAQQEKERLINVARGERNLLIPAERGKRDRAIAEAEGYAQRVIQEATGRANAFLSELAEYEKSPDITRQRLYLEAMEEVLGQVQSTVIIDDDIKGLLPTLKLDDTLNGSGGK